MLQNLTTKLVKKNRLTSDVWLFSFRLTEPSFFNFVPGQYLILNVPQANDQIVKRLYSLPEPASLKKTFDLLVKVVPDGAASTYLMALEPGQSASFQGPAGLFFLRQRNRDKIFLVTGTGIAPIRSMATSYLPHQRFYRFILYWGLPALKDLYFFDELKRFTRLYPNFNFKICLSREDNLSTVKEEDRHFFSLGRIDHVWNSSPWKNNYPVSGFDYYLCGGRIVVESLKVYLYSLGIAPSSVFFEKF